MSESVLRALDSLAQEPGGAADGQEHPRAGPAVHPHHCGRQERRGASVPLYDIFGRAHVRLSSVLFV